MKTFPRIELSELQDLSVSTSLFHYKLLIRWSAKKAQSAYFVYVVSLSKTSNSSSSADQVTASVEDVFFRSAGAC